MKTQITQQQLYRLVMQSRTACAVLQGPQLTLVVSNSRFEALTACRTEMSLAERGWTFDERPFATACQEALRRGTEISGTHLKLGAAGSIPLAAPRLSPLSDEAGGSLLLELAAPDEDDAPSIPAQQATVRSVEDVVLGGPGANSENNQHLRSLIDSAPFPIALYVGREMRVAYANRSLMDVWGKGYNVIGKTYYEALPELRSQGVYEILDGVYTTGKPYDVRNQRIDLEVNGTMKTSFFNYSFTPVYDTSGAVYGILNTAADVTDSNVARQLLEESELFATSIIENSPVAKMVLTGENMVIKTINGNMLEMLGRSRDIVGMPFTEALPELQQSPVVFMLRHVLASGETHVEPEGRLDFTRFGKPHTGYYSYIYKPLPNTSGDIYGIIITATDVTDLVTTRKRIEEAQSALEGAIELAELATWSYDCRTGTLNYSPRLRDWHGFGAGDAISFEKILEQIPELEKSAAKSSFELLREPGSQRNYNEEYPVRNLVTGAIHIIHAQGRLSLDDHGVPFKWSGTAHDVTRQRKAQLALEQLVQQRTEELATSNEELQTTNEELADVNASLMHSNEELAQYAYVASHDLQEPLRKIRLFSGMLQEKLGAQQEEASLANRIAQSAARMHQLIRDLLEFSRLLKSDELIALVNLNDVVQAVASDFELSIREKSAQLDIGQLPVIEGVGLQMNQLFYNLIGNAIKFSAPGRAPVIRVESQAMSEQELLRHIPRPIHGVTYHDIRISDNGIGLEPEYTDQIFEVFKRLHTRESYPGSGIGLALCRRIVSNHSGLLYVESVPGEGSSFHILLPSKQQSY